MHGRTIEATDTIGIHRSKMTTFVSSLKVPNVQELAKEKPSSVPSRYVRPDPTKVTNGLSSQEIPVVDLQNLLNTHDTVNQELEKLHFACQEWGFFQVIWTINTIFFV